MNRHVLTCCASLLAVVVATAPSAPRSAQADEPHCVPFSATGTATIRDLFFEEDGVLVLLADAEGTGSHVGRWTADSEVHFFPPDYVLSEGITTIFAADGDIAGLPAGSGVLWPRNGGIDQWKSES